MDSKRIEKLARLIRYYILLSSTEAGSGHPTSSLSATDLVTVLFFAGFFRFDFDNPNNINNDRLIFSKGHATPLLYSLYLACGKIRPAEIMKLRKFDSPLEGHPTTRFKFTEAATGSLGQGLSVGVGMALGIKKSGEGNKARVYVLLGDGEMAEGSVWEAANIASYYRLSNLTAIIDVNRLGQSQETSLGWNTSAYKERLEAFGWRTMEIDGHNYGEIAKAYSQSRNEDKPFAVIAKTIKGKGVSFLENKEGWHGKPLKKEELKMALEELGAIELELRGEVGKPESRIRIQQTNFQKDNRWPALKYEKGTEVATRKAYGNALARLGDVFAEIVSLDGDVKNSTYAEIFKERHNGRFFEMFIAEQNMVGVGVGMARLGYIPFVSSFACFLTRAFDQIRLAAIGRANVKFCGSHAGVSIGEDGPSQMGLEDLAMFGVIPGSVVLYPADAVSTEKLIENMITHEGICYIRTTRPTTPVLYDNSEEFPIGGCKVHRLKPDRTSVYTKANKKRILIIAAGVTLFEALKAQGELLKEGIEAVVVDCYSIKPIDEKILKELAEETDEIITVEDHYFDGGLGDAVLNVFADNPRVLIKKLAVVKMPRSGKPAELLAYEEIDSAAIIKAGRMIV